MVSLHSLVRTHVTKMQMPLPKLVPVPETDMLTALLGMDIIVNVWECGEALTVNGTSYVKYSLPSGWRMMDNSQRADLPLFHVVDEKGMTRATVHGSWKVAYDNDLSWSIAEQPAPFKPRDTPKEESEPLKLIEKLLQGLASEDLVIPAKK